MKRPLQALAGLLAGAVAAVLLLWWQSLPYHAAVRIAAPGGVTYIAFFDSAPDREACEAAARRFFAPIEKDCRDCRVEEVSCTRLPPRSEASYWVRAEAVSIAVYGEDVNARESCQLTAEQLTAAGHPARCEKALPAGHPAGR